MTVEGNCKNLSPVLKIIEDTKTKTNKQKNQKEEFKRCCGEEDT